MKTKSVTVTQWLHIMPLKRLQKLNNQRKQLIPKIKISPNLRLRMEKINRPQKKLRRRMLLKSQLSLPVRRQQREQKKMLKRPHQRTKNLQREAKLLPKLQQRAPKPPNLLQKIPKNLPVRKRKKLLQPKGKRRRACLRLRQSQKARKSKSQRTDPSLRPNQL